MHWPGSTLGNIASSMLFRRLRFLIGFCALILGSAPALAQSTARAYLPVTDELAGLVLSKFKIRIEPGLYYTDPWKAKLIAELRLSKFEEEIRDIPLTYLQKDPVIVQLFRGDAWRGSDKDLSARIGWVNVFDDTGAKMRQLWLEKPNRERWLLYQHAVGAFPSSGNSPSRLIGIPRHFLRVTNGLVAFNPSWMLWHKVFDGPLTNEFNFVQDGEEAVQMPVKVIARTFEANENEVPLVHYNARNEVLLAATWPQIPSDGIAELPEEADIVAVNLSTHKTRKVMTAIRWPYLIDSSGIWNLREDPVRRVQQLVFYPLNWGTLKTAKSKVIHETDTSKGTFHFRAERFWYSEKGGGDYAFTTEGGKVRLKLTESDFTPLDSADAGAKLRPFDQLPVKSGYPLQTLRSGAFEPRAFDAGLNSQLAIALGQASRTWANVVYEDGMFVDDVIQSFFWGIDTGHIDTGPELRQIDSVFSFSASELFSKKSDDNLKDIFARLKEAIDGTRTILYLRDFPVADPGAASSPDAQKHLQFFAQSFERCLNTGTCRVVTSMRREVFEAMSKTHPLSFQRSERIVIGPMDDMERLAVSRILSIPLQENSGILFNRAGFSRAMQLCASEFADARGAKLASPGFEEEFLRRFFRQAVAEKRKYPDQNLNELGVEFVKRLESGLQNAPASVQALRRIDFTRLNAFLKRNTAGRAHHRVIDEIADALETQITGTRPANVGPPAFVLIGNSGVGKSHIALLVAQYLMAGGDEDKALMMNDQDTLLFDMGYEAGSTFRIDPKSPPALKLKTSPAGSIAIFDDIQKAERKSSIAVIGQILDKGFYARGTAEQIDFNKIGAVFLTTTWGSHLIAQGKLKDGTFEEGLREFLIESEKGPQIDEGLWGRLSTHLYPLPDLRDWELLDAAFIFSRNLARRYDLAEGVGVRIDPAIFTGLLDQAHETKGQGRDMVKGIMKAFPVLGKQIRTEGVSRLVLTRSRAGKFVVKTDLDPDFKTEWARVDAFYREYNESGIDAYLRHLEATATRPDWKSLLQEKAKDDEQPESVP
jgi:hypothetical protein